MNFCGQCGFLLPPSVAKCPRCGAVTQYNQTAGETYTNDETKLTDWDGLQQQPTQTASSAPPAKMAGTAFAGISGHGAATQDANTPFHGTDTPIPESAQGPLRLGPFPQAAGGYQNAYAADPTANVGFVVGGNVVERPQARRSGKAGLVIWLLVVLLILAGSGAVFVIGPARVLSYLGLGASTTPQGRVTPQPSSPEEQAKAVITRYYTDINEKNYRDAYTLWVKRSNTPAYETFAQGYAHTQRVDVTFGDVVKQTDGSYKLNVTLLATEDAQSGTGTRQQQYTGYYIIIQRPDGTWKIYDGHLQ